MEQTIISTSSGSSNVAGERRPEIFANNFWGKEEAGYDALMSRLRQAKQTCDEVKNMFQERALIEEEYAKKLMKLSKSPIGKDETGSLRDALEVCRQEMEATAQEHITLSQKIRTELVQEISHFILRQKESRKLQQAIVDRSLRNKREQSVLVQRAKEKYEAECVKITGLLASKNSVMGKDLDKLNLRIEKTQMGAKAADQEYIQLVKNIQVTTKTWNYDWKTACDKFQDLEEDRIDKLKSFLWTYANLISTVCVADDESCERIRISLENCNVEKDILIFIRERATGPDIPEPQSYVNFYAGPKENGVRYKRASFDRVPEYVDVITTPTTQLDPNKRLSLCELPITNNNNSKDNCVYHTRNDSDGYSNVNIDRATLYANTTSTKKNNNNGGIVNEVERTEKNEVEEEPVDPRSKQMLSIGNNVLEVQTNIGQLNNKEDQDEIAKALANLELTDEYNNNNKNDSDVNNDNKDNYDHNDHNNNNNSNDNHVSRFNTSTSMNNISNNGNGEGFVKKPLPNNFPIDKPQPPTPPVQDNIQQQKKSHDIYHQRNNSQSQFTPYNNNIPIAPTVIGVTNNNHNNNNNNNNNNNTPYSIAPSTTSQHQQQQQQYMINGPGDLRRSQPDYTNAANNGPLSSQQQQISQNLSMKSKSSNRNYQQQPEGPGDARRLSNSPNMFSSPPPISSQVQYQSPQGGYQQIQGQMTPQNLVLTQGRISPRQITASPSHTPSNNINNNNINDLNRSDTQRTTSSNTSNNSLGIQLDVNGRVKQDDLAEAFIANGGRLPPESAKFQTRSQGIPQGGQMSPQGQPIFQYNSFNRPLQQMSTNPSVITSQSSYNGSHQQLQQQSHPQVHRSNTVNSGSTLNNAFPYKQPQQGVNVNSQLPQGSIGRPQGSIGRPQGSIGRPPLRRTLPVGIQQSQSQPQIQPTQLLQQPIGTQVLGHPQTHYQNPNFYSPPVSGYSRPPIGSANNGGNAQGFQQMQVPQQQLMQQQPPIQLQPYTSLTASQQQPQQQQQQLPQQMNLQPLHLQYQRQPLPGSDIPDSSGSQNHPRTEDGKPIEFYVKALYDYQKTIPEEMSFTTGDVIAVLSTHSDGWWEGEIVDDSRKNRGLFPSNYTKVLE